MDAQEGPNLSVLEGLNEIQREAVTCTEGFVRVVAGAGSGKTRTLSRRFAYLVLELGVMPQNILCVTFTNKSANEMRTRIRQLTGDNDTGYISTFHGFCVSVLLEDSNAVSYPKSFLVLDNSDIDDILQLIYEERGLSLRDMTFSSARDMIEIRKCVSDVLYYEDMISMPLGALRAKYLDSAEARDIIFWGYIYYEKKCFGLDYNDLINFTLHIFATNDEVRLKWQQRLEYIIVDEFQDIDRPQYRLMEVLCDYHKNLFVVGDPDQTIYTWRGAEIRFLLEFDKRFSPTKTIMMMSNYRSTPEILTVANSLIDKNSMRIKKELEPVISGGDPVICNHCETAEKEAQWIAATAKQLQEAGVPLRDTCILYRAHYVTRSLEDVFLRCGLPYKIYSGQPFYGRREVKDALAYLRFSAIRDDLSFLRIVNNPKRGMGERRIRFLKEYAEKSSLSLYDSLKATQGDEIFKGTGASRFIAFVESFSGMLNLPLPELLAALLDESGYMIAMRTSGSQERLDNLAELVQSVHEYETSCGEEATLMGYLSRVALLTNMDSESKADAIRMMTVHSAKGLEFPYVFLCGLNENIFPSKRTETVEQMEEERRLCFVAMTRAMKGLFISEAAGSGYHGGFRYPSRFIFDIDPKLLSYVERPDEGLVRGAKRFIKESEERMRIKHGGMDFSVGERVYHEVFGSGVISCVDADTGAYTIEFDKLSTPRRISVKAKLTRDNKR